jgi:hypothetical protein
MITVISYSTDSTLTTLATELAKWKLDLVGLLEVRWYIVGPVRAGDIIFFYRQGNENYKLGQGCLYTEEECQQLRD